MAAKNIKEIPKEDLAELWFSFNHNVLEQLQSRARELKKDGITQEIIAARLGVGPAVVSRRLKGRQNMSMRTMHDLARAMGCRLRVAVDDLSALTPSNNNPNPWKAPVPPPLPRKAIGSSEGSVRTLILSGAVTANG